MTKEEIIIEFDKAGISFDYADFKKDGRTSDYIDDDFSSVLDLVHELVNKNNHIHIVSGMFSAEKLEKAFDDGVESEKQRCGYFDIENYR